MAKAGELPNDKLVVLAAFVAGAAKGLVARTHERRQIDSIQLSSVSRPLLFYSPMWLNFSLGEYK